MTTEFVLLLGIYGFLLLGAFLGDLGPIETFKKSGPRLGARIERNIATGTGFRDSPRDGKGVNWVEPPRDGGTF
jgi:hypothetical protein